ncbi:hypothetical protein RMSM_06603 [Rhodopirellula maiorica SM1]|uniref:Uncharacterized protein n=1 Tax=Rhodopirellula maiorica SM1 TaxID=1265738 RepID=M5RBM7_9BACT|nr:hypothetical protein RMSM_06603 [Rhodopirellula maiorica SM1]
MMTTMLGRSAALHRVTITPKQTQQKMMDRIITALTMTSCVSKFEVGG